MSGTPLVVIKKWIGHGSEEMVERYTHFRPDYMPGELDRVPDFAVKSEQKMAASAPDCSREAPVA